MPEEASSVGDGIAALIAEERKYRTSRNRLPIRYIKYPLRYSTPIYRISAIGSFTLHGIIHPTLVNGWCEQSTVNASTNLARPVPLGLIQASRSCYCTLGAYPCYLTFNFRVILPPPPSLHIWNTTPHSYCAAHTTQSTKVPMETQHGAMVGCQALLSPHTYRSFLQRAGHCLSVAGLVQV